MNEIEINLNSDNSIDRNKYNNMKKNPYQKIFTKVPNQIGAFEEKAIGIINENILVDKQYSISDVERFKNKIIIQDKFFENEDDENEKDEVFIILKAYEKEILSELFYKNIPSLNNILKAKKI